MNLILSKESLQLYGITSDGKSVVIKDTIGFTNENSVSGFNKYNTSFIDSLGNEYPKVENVVLKLVVQFLPYSGEPVLITPELLTSVTRTMIEESSYEDLAYEWSVPVEKDGHYKFYLLALDVDDTSQDYYFDSSDGLIKDSAGNQVNEVDLIDLLTVEQGILHELILPKISSKLSKLSLESRELDISAGSRQSRKRSIVNDQRNYIKLIVAGSQESFYNGDYDEETSFGKKEAQRYIESLLNWIENESIK